MFFSRQHFHFAGIGGIGMSGIAEVLLNLGYTISGSDLKLSPTTDRLATLGATIYEGHKAENVAGAKALVVSSAVEESNPEVQEARRTTIPVIPRGELLAELMRLKYGIAIAGSHGKTTTPSLTAPVLKLSPILAVVTNIDREHLDHYPSIAEIRAAFLEFIQKVPFYGAAILCLDDENVQQLLPSVNRRAITYGRSHQAALRIADMECGPFESRFTVWFQKHELGKFH